MEWITAKDCVGISVMPTDVHKTRAKLDRLCAGDADKKRKKSGSKAFEYHISILPPAVQAALLRKAGKVKVGGMTLDLPKPQAPRYCKEALWARWNKANTKGQEKAQHCLTAVLAVRNLVLNGVGKMDAFASVAEQFQVAQASLIRWHYKVQAYELADWAPVLLPRYQDNAETKSKNKLAACSPAAWETFKADYLRPEKPSFAACYYRLVRMAAKQGWEVPSESALRRRMSMEVPVTHKILLREGEHALHQMFPPQERSVLDLEAMQWITGDGYQHNVFVTWFNGEVLRPKTWFWMDVYSRKIVGWRCDVSENTDSIRLSLMDVCRSYGIPREVTIDNTRAAANKWMTGGVPNRYRFKVKEDDPKGIIPLLGIELHWTSVILGKGHGQAKPVERAFGVGGMDEFIDKHPLLAGAYTGPNPMDKPDNYGERAVDAETFLRALAEGVEMYNQRAERDTEVCRGVMSFDEAFAASYGQAVVRKATPEQLQLLMLQAEAVRVSEHGTITLEAGGNIKSRKNRYSCEALYQYIGRKVVARFDPQSLHDAVVVYTLDGLLIGYAECLEKVGFGDTHAAREHKRHRTQFVKANKHAAHAKKAMSVLEVAAMMPGPSDETPPETKVVEMVRPVALGNAALAVQPAPLAASQPQTEPAPVVDYEARYIAANELALATLKKSRI